MLHSGFRHLWFNLLLSLFIMKVAVGLRDTNPQEYNNFELTLFTQLVLKNPSCQAEVRKIFADRPPLKSIFLV